MRCCIHKGPILLRHIPRNTVFIGLLMLVSIVALYSITVGPMNISISDSLSSLVWQSNNIAGHINLVIHEIRFPRTLLCLLVGAILALCGTVMQGLFRNPLAEPGIIGVSAGSAL